MAAERAQEGVWAPPSLSAHTHARTHPAHSSGGPGPGADKGARVAREKSLQKQVASVEGGGSQEESKIVQRVRSIEAEAKERERNIKEWAKKVEEFEAAFQALKVQLPAGDRSPAGRCPAHPSRRARTPRASTTSTSSWTPSFATSRRSSASTTTCSAPTRRGRACRRRWRTCGRRWRSTVTCVRLRPLAPTAPGLNSTPPSAAQRRTGSRPRSRTSRWSVCWRRRLQSTCPVRPRPDGRMAPVPTHPPPALAALCGDPQAAVGQCGLCGAHRTQRRLPLPALRHSAPHVRHA